MANIKRKLFGNINIDGVKEAFKKAPEKKTTYKDQEQLKVNAVEWEDGGITISINYKEGEEWQRINLGNLRVSTLDDAPASAVANDNDFGSPF